MSTPLAKIRLNLLINKTNDVEIKWAENPIDVECNIDAVDTIGITHALTFFIILKSNLKAEHIHQFIKWYNSQREDYKPKRIIFYHQSILIAHIDKIPIDQMSYNESVLTQLLKHPLVNEFKHKKLTADEYIAFKTQYNLTDGNMTRIAVSDPVCRFMGLVVGNVIQSERRGTNEISVRLVSVDG